MAAVFLWSGRRGITREASGDMNLQRACSDAACMSVMPEGLLSVVDTIALLESAAGVFPEKQQPCFFLSMDETGPLLFSGADVSSAVFNVQNRYSLADRLQTSS